MSKMKTLRVADSSHFGVDVKQVPHNIRLLVLPEGICVVATIIGSEEGILQTLYPMLMGFGRDDKGQLAAYELEPYLDNMVEFNMIAPTVVTFMSSQIVSVAAPTQHLFHCYMANLSLRRSVYYETHPLEKKETLH